MATKKKVSKKKVSKKAAVEKVKMGRPLQIRGPLGELAELLGGRDKLAEEIGVSVRTIARWASGEERGGMPPRPVRKALAALAIMHKVEAPYATTEECPPPAWLNDPRPNTEEETEADDDD